eukprot:Gb_12224 [translate_table: standard]
MATPLVKEDLSVFQHSDLEGKFCELQRLPGGVYLLTFKGRDKHVFDPHAITAINGVLDFVESAEDASVLVTTNEGKFYSNGMDAEYLRQGDTNEAMVYIQTFQNLASRLLCFSIPTVAIIRGHAVGAGCMFALAHDYRLMSSNHGFIFVNEVDIGMSLTPGNSAILRCKLSPATYHEAVLTGRRYDGSSASEHGLVHGSYPDATETLQAGLKKGCENPITCIALATMPGLCGQHYGEYGTVQQHYAGCTVPHTA